VGKKSKPAESDPPWNDLFGLACKLRGLGELLKSSKPEMILTEDAAYGIGSLILEVADSVSGVLEAIEDQR